MYRYTAAMHGIEQRLAGLPHQTDIRISDSDALALLESGLYARSLGIYPGAHWRRENGTGCFHLRVYNGVATLHFDAFDPRRFPADHFFETPALWVSAAVAILFIITFV